MTRPAARRRGGRRHERVYQRSNGMKSFTVLNECADVPCDALREDSVPQESGAIRPGDAAASTPKRSRPSNYSHVAPPCACIRRPQLRSADRHRRPRRRLVWHRARRRPSRRGSKLESGLPAGLRNSLSFKEQHLFSNIFAYERVGSCDDSKTQGTSSTVWCCDHTTGVAYVRSSHR